MIPLKSQFAGPESWPAGRAQTIALPGDCMWGLSLFPAFLLLFFANRSHLLWPGESGGDRERESEGLVSDHA